jgi:hypothetical protein
MVLVSFKSRDRLASLALDLRSVPFSQQAESRRESQLPSQCNNSEEEQAVLICPIEEQHNPALVARVRLAQESGTSAWLAWLPHTGPGGTYASVRLRHRNMPQLMRVWRKEIRRRDASLQHLQLVKSQPVTDPHLICPWGTPSVPAPAFERVCELLREQAIGCCMPGVERLYWRCATYRHSRLQVYGSPFHTPYHRWRARSANVGVESGRLQCETCLWDRAKRTLIVHGPSDYHSQQGLIAMLDVRVAPYLQVSYPVCFQASSAVGSSGDGGTKRCQPGPSTILLEPCLIEGENLEHTQFRRLGAARRTEWWTLKLIACFLAVSRAYPPGDQEEEAIPKARPRHNHLLSVERLWTA